MQETRETPVLFLGQEEPLEESVAAHSSMLAWETPRTEEAGGPQPMGSQRVGLDRARALTASFREQKRGRSGSKVEQSEGLQVSPEMISPEEGLS